MTIRERLQTIGQAVIGKKPDPIIKEVVKEVTAKQKSVTGGFLDFNTRGLSSETKISTKLLESNKGWVYRNNDVIAKEVATIEFELFRVKVEKDSVVYEPILSHEVLTLLDKFNEFTSASDGFYITQSHRKLAGDCFWYLDGKAPNVKSVYILPPDKVTIELGKEKGSMRIIDGYKYEDTIDGKTVKIEYRPDSIIHFKIPNPNNSYRGISATQAAAEAIDSDTMAMEANRQLFERGLISNFMLTTEKSLTPEQLKQLHAEFKSTYGGVQNAYKVPIMGGGITASNLQMSNRDAQFLEQQAWVRDKITSIFGNSKAVLGVTDDVNRANAEATITNWKRTTIRSEMKGICDTLNEFLVPKYGEGLLLGFKDPVPEDESLKVDKVTKLIASDVITKNEARELLGYSEVEGGDDFNAAPPMPNEIPKSLRYVKRNHILRRAGVYEKIAEFKKAKEKARPVAEEIVKRRNRKDTKAPSTAITEIFSEEQTTNYYKKQIELVEVKEKIFQDTVEKFINTHIVEKALEAVPAEISEMQNKALLNEEDLLVQAGLDFTPLLMDLAQASGQEALDLLELDKVYAPKNLAPAIERRVNLFARSMIDTDKGKLIDLIAAGLSEGSSVDQIRRNITDTFSTYSKSQAERITRTEVIHASNLAAEQAWADTGVVEAKEWLIAPGACPLCEPYNGAIQVLKGGFYPETKFAQGNPPLHPNCRCVLLPVLFYDKSKLCGSSSMVKSVGGKTKAMAISCDISPKSETLYRGEGNNVPNHAGTLLGDALYMSKDRSVAANYGKVKKAQISIAPKDVLTIKNEAQLDKLTKDSISNALKRGRDLDTFKAIPQYIRDLGFKAADITDKVVGEQSTAIIDKALINIIRSQLDKSKQVDRELELIEENRKLQGYVKELEEEIVNG